MSERQISWYRHNGEPVAGIEDTGKGWAVVDSLGEVVYAVGEYSHESRVLIEKQYVKYLERVR